MEQELTSLADALRRIAYDAGCALLRPAAAGATQHCAARYNHVFGRLRTLEPALVARFAPLPEDASPGSVRLAARDVAGSLEHTLAHYHLHPIVA